MLNCYTLFTLLPYRWRDQQVMSSNPTRSESCVTTVGKLFTPMCLCHQAVLIGTGQGAGCTVAGKVTAGLAEGNGSLPRADWLHTRNQLQAQRSITSMGSLYLYLFVLQPLLLLLLLHT